MSMQRTRGILEGSLDDVLQKLYTTDLGKPKSWYEKLSYMLERYPEIFFEGCYNLERMAEEGKRDRLVDVAEKEAKKKEHYLDVPQNEKRAVRQHFYESMVVMFADINGRFTRTRVITLKDGTIEIEYTFALPAFNRDSSFGEKIAEYFLDEEKMENANKFKELAEGLRKGTIKRKSAKELLDFSEADEIETINDAVARRAYSEFAEITLAGFPLLKRAMIPAAFRYLPKRTRKTLFRRVVEWSNSMRIYAEHQEGTSRISLISGLDEMNDNPEEDDWASSQYQGLLKAVTMPVIEHFGPLLTIYPREGAEYSNPEREIRTIVGTLETLLRKL